MGRRGILTCFGDLNNVVRSSQGGSKVKGGGGQRDREDSPLDEPLFVDRPGKNQGHPGSDLLNKN